MARSERVHGIKKVRSHRALISFTYCTLHAWRSLAALPCDFKMSLELGVFRRAHVLLRITDIRLCTVGTVLYLMKLGRTLLGRVAEQHQMLEYI